MPKTQHFYPHECRYFLFYLVFCGRKWNNVGFYWSNKTINPSMSAWDLRNCDGICIIVNWFSNNLDTNH